MQEMDTKRKDHLPKFVTLETAVQAVRSGDWVDYGFGVGFPELLDHALAARKGEVRDVTHFTYSIRCEPDLLRLM